MLIVKAHKLSRFKNHKRTLTTCCYFWNSDVSVLYATLHKRRFLVPTVAHPSLVPTGPWAGAPGCPESSQEPAQPWASPAAGAPALWHLTSSWGALQEAWSWQHRTRNWHFLMRTVRGSCNRGVFPGLPKARSLPGATRAGAGRFPKEHRTNTAHSPGRHSQGLCPVPRAPAEASLLLPFLSWEVSHPRESPLLLGVWP